MNGAERRSNRSFHCRVLPNPDVIADRAGRKISATASDGSDDEVGGPQIGTARPHFVQARLG
jgi:hypothetical protein